MLGVGDGVYVGELAGGLADRAQELRRFHARHEAIPADDHDIDERKHRGGEECQLIGAVGAGFVERLQHAVVGECAGRVEQAVGHGQRQREEALGVLAVALLLTGGAQLGILGRVHNAQADRADAHEYDRADGQRGIVLAAQEDERHQRHQRAGGIADGRGHRQLDVPQAHIAQRHGADIEQRHGQIGEYDRKADLRAADKDFIRGVQTHHRADGDDHFEMGEVIVLSLTADFGEQVASAPAEKRNQGKPEPHGIHLSL